MNNNDHVLNRIRPAWMEVYLDRLRENARRLKGLLGSDTGLMAVIKSDAYSHGSVQAARAFIEGGADYLAVATLSEAIKLRRAGIKGRILVFGYSPFEQSLDIVKYNISQTVYCLDQAKSLSEAAKTINKKVRVHIKIDTGMSRLGFQPVEENLGIIREIYNMENIEVEGIYSHFVESEVLDDSFTRMQYRCFMDFLERLEDLGLNFKIRHISNAAAVIQYPEYNLDMVRVGIPLYGVYPPGDLNKATARLDLTFSIRARAAYIKWIDKGVGVSYNRTFIADSPRKILTLPIGYGDGYTQELANKIRVRVGDKKAAIVGRVCMDQLMVDITEVENLKIGDYVSLIDREDADLVATRDIANISKRLPRVYYDGGKIVAIEEF